MATMIMNQLAGLKKVLLMPQLEVDIEEKKRPIRALPHNWYTSQAMYELERRGIFSKRWQLITHSSRFQEPGAYLRYDIAGYNFFLCRDRQGNITAHHNVCRHRGYPIVEKDSGTAKILSCRYHGWSYGLNGKLAKAPGYQELEGFDKSKNGLLPIHTHIDNNGFVWINLDAGDEPEVKWDDYFAGIDTQERHKQFNFDDYVFDHTWKMDGPYNWKILADNYNECYHCPTTHPDIGAVANLESYSVKTKDGNIFHNAGTTEEQRQQGLTVESTYHFPNVSTNVLPNFFMIQRFVPSGPTKSSMQYEVYRNKHASEEDFQLANQIYKRVMSEDKELCLQAQKNLDSGVFINGELHSRMEEGPLHIQAKVREAVMDHWALEQRAGHEIWPARQRLPNEAAGSQEDMDFCEGLTCSEANEKLAW